MFTFVRVLKSLICTIYRSYKLKPARCSSVVCCQFRAEARVGGGRFIVGGRPRPKASGFSCDQIKKILQLFLNDLEHISDLKCILNLERVLDNMNAFLILKNLFKNFCSLPFRSVSFLYK